MDKEDNNKAVETDNPKKKSKIWIIVAIVVGIPLLVAIFSSSSDDIEKVRENQQQETEVEGVGETKNEEETFRIGDVVDSGDLLFTINSARWEEGDEYWGPDEGERWLVLDCTIENEGGESVTISSLLMFTLYDKDGYSQDTEMFADTKGSLDGELGAGRKMSGELAFDVEEGQTEWEFIFEPELFSFGQAIFLITEEEVD